MARRARVHRAGPAKVRRWPLTFTRLLWEGRRNLVTDLPTVESGPHVRVQVRSHEVPSRHLWNQKESRDAKGRHEPNRP
jgi:hypothetical protein